MNLNPPLLCVVIPNKNGARHLDYSIPSILASDYPNIAVAVVDDRSTDDSIMLLKQKYGKVKVLENTGKKGFAATVNIGVKYAIEQRAEYVAVSNSDIKIPGWLIASAVDLFLADKNIGVIGFKEILGDSVRSSFPTSPVKAEPLITKNIAGCFFIVKTSIFLKIGLFDEDYFMYGEDNDFFYRVMKGGFSEISTNLPVWHYGEGASGARSFAPVWLAYRNALRFSIKNEGFVAALQMGAVLFYHGCLPHFNSVPANPSLGRLRRYNPAFNCFILLSSILWNLWHLPETISARQAYL